MELKYAGFWPRSLSLLIDYVIIAPIALLLMKTIALGNFTFTVIFIGWSIFLWATYLFMLYNFGGTPGKLVVGIKVRKLSGEKAGFKEVLLRSIVDIILGFILTTAYLIAINSMDVHHYLELKSKFRSAYLHSLYPPWRWPFDILSNIWIWGELAVLLFNKKRRAIHDFIAGTVVIHMKIKEINSK
jgi:uncharacterized RDD family membrane protein YckC